MDKRERAQTRGGGCKPEEEGIDERETEYSFRTRRVEQVLKYNTYNL
jgi:hypothetical protein